MTFQELVERLQMECAVSGTITTLDGVTGEFLRLKTWTNQSYVELQNERFNWEFLRSSELNGAGVSFVTVAGQGIYPLGTGSGTVGVTANGFASWVERSFRDQTTTVGVNDQTPLAWISYDAWRDGYSMGAQQTVETRPVSIAVSPDNGICVGPWPTSAYTLTGDYYMSPRQMEDDDDEPTNIPFQWQMAIVYQAMIYYGFYENAPEVISRGRMYYRKLRRQLGNLRGGRVTAGRALA